MRPTPRTNHPSTALASPERETQVLVLPPAASAVQDVYSLVSVAIRRMKAKQDQDRTLTKDDATCLSQLLQSLKLAMALEAEAEKQMRLKSLTDEELRARVEELQKMGV